MNRIILLSVSNIPHTIFFRCKTKFKKSINSRSFDNSGITLFQNRQNKHQGKHVENIKTLDNKLNYLLNS